MAIASPSTPTFSPSFCCRTRTDSTRFVKSSSLRFNPGRPPLHRPLTFTACLNSSTRSNGYVSPDNNDNNNNDDDDDLQDELQHGVSISQRSRRGSPVFVALPVDAVTGSDQLRRRKAMAQSFRALAAAGVEGVVMEVWWGVVEREAPGVYDWEGYAEIVAMARRCGLKVRAALVFHQCGTGPGDPFWFDFVSFLIFE